MAFMKALVTTKTADYIYIYKMQIMNTYRFIPAENGAIRTGAVKRKHLIDELLQFPISQLMHGMFNTICSRQVMGNEITDNQIHRGLEKPVHDYLPFSKCNSCKCKAFWYNFKRFCL